MALGFIVEHFRRYRQLSSPWTFCWKITIEGVVVPIIILIPLYFIFSSQRRTFLDDLSAIQMIIFGVILAPSIETLLFQFVPINIAHSLRASFRVKIFVSTAVFAVPHFLGGFPNGISAGIGGFYLGFTYAHWLEKSLWTAFWTTTISHALHNFAVFVILSVH